MSALFQFFLFLYRFLCFFLFVFFLRHINSKLSTFSAINFTGNNRKHRSFFKTGCY